MWLTLPRVVGALSLLPVLIACAAAGDPASGSTVITALERSGPQTVTDPWRAWPADGESLVG
jgi:hypothetical protein